MQLPPVVWPPLLDFFSSWPYTFLSAVHNGRLLLLSAHELSQPMSCQRMLLLSAHELSQSILNIQPTVHYPFFLPMLSLELSCARTKEASDGMHVSDILGITTLRSFLAIAAVPVQNIRSQSVRVEAVVATAVRRAGVLLGPRFSRFSIWANPSLCSFPSRLLTTCL